MLNTLEQQTMPRFMAALQLQDGKGAGKVRIPLAVTGTWVRGANHFSITAADLESIVRNFCERQNGEINVDYDHASGSAGPPQPSVGMVRTHGTRPRAGAKPRIPVHLTSHRLGREKQTDRQAAGGDADLSGADQSAVSGRNAANPAVRSGLSPGGRKRRDNGRPRGRPINRRFHEEG